jgi:carboxypeptidase C (cathepsin A)
VALPSIAASHMETSDGPAGSLDALRDVEQFATTTYLVDLAAGMKSSPGLSEALARYTGLPADLIARHNNRVSVSLFAREYQKASGRALSRYDGTVSAPVPRPATDSHFDPILDGAVNVLTPVFVEYARTELGYHTDLQYRLLNREVSGKWDFGSSANRQGFAGALDQLQHARTLNPGLRILIANGYTDLVTTYLGSRFLVGQLEPIDGAAPIELRVYRGGHMMYLRPSSRRALSQDARGLYGAANLGQ